MCGCRVAAGAIPSEAEVEAMRLMEELTVEINFLDNSVISVPVFDDTSSAELLETVCEETNVQLGSRCV